MRPSGEAARAVGEGNKMKDACGRQVRLGLPIVEHCTENCTLLHKEMAARCYDAASMGETSQDSSGRVAHPPKGYVCLIGRFGEPAYDHRKFVAELRSSLGDEVFPWTSRQLLFRPATCDLPYIFDKDMKAVADGYKKCRNEAGFRSLIGVTYNYDSFGASDGLYGKIVIRCAAEEVLSEESKIISKVFAALRNHVPLQEGQKVKLDLGTKRLSEQGDIPRSINEMWMKMIVERKGKITQHILFGKKGEARKVHVFCRPDEPATYEETRQHDPPTVAPFRQVSGVVVRNGIAYTYHVDPREVVSNRKTDD